MMHARSCLPVTLLWLLAPHSLPAQQNPWELLRVGAEPSKGFQWPYYLAIPVKAAAPTALVVAPIAIPSPSSDANYLDQQAKQIAEGAARTAASLGMPVLTPAFPRPSQTVIRGTGISFTDLYTHALSREALTTTEPGLVRLDLQLIAMIDDARAKMASRGISVPTRVLLQGFSASGAFALRFALLHPDRVKAVSAGAPNSFPMLPVAEWKGYRLPYPVGVADLKELTGQPFDLEAFRRVQFQIYVGDADSNDAVAFGDAFEDAERNLVYEVFGGPPAFLRWPTAEAAYRSVQAACQFLVWPGISHSYIPAGEIWGFLDNNRKDPPPPVPARPLLFKLYFPHVTADNTLVLANTSDAIVRGDVQAWPAEGGKALQTVSLTLNPQSRREIALRQQFTNPERVGYVVFVSDSGFVAAYTVFASGGQRAFVPSLAPGFTGALFRSDKQAALSLAAVNVDTAPAAVQWSAVDEYGREVASGSETLASGVKLVTSLDKLLAPAASSAVLIRYSSDKKLAICALQSSSGGASLEALTPLPDYIP